MSDDFYWKERLAACRQRGCDGALSDGGRIRSCEVFSRRATQLHCLILHIVSNSRQGLASQATLRVRGRVRAENVGNAQSCLQEAQLQERIQYDRCWALYADDGRNTVTSDDFKLVVVRPNVRSIVRFCWVNILTVLWD